MKYRILRGRRWLSDVIAHNVIHAAKRGLMTKAAKDLLLVPDTRYGRSVDGLQAVRPVKKNQCKTLVQAYPRSEKSAL